MRKETYEEFSARIKTTKVTLDEVVQAIAEVAKELGEGGVMILLTAPLILEKLYKGRTVAEKVEQGYREGEEA